MSAKLTADIFCGILTSSPSLATEVEKRDDDVMEQYISLFLSLSFFLAVASMVTLVMRRVLTELLLDFFQGSSA